MISIHCFVCCFLSLESSSMLQMSLEFWEYVKVKININKLLNINIICNLLTVYAYILVPFVPLRIFLEGICFEWVGREVYLYLLLFYLSFPGRRLYFDELLNYLKGLKVIGHGLLFFVRLGGWLLVMEIYLFGVGGRWSYFRLLRVIGHVGDVFKDFMYNMCYKQKAYYCWLFDLLFD